MGNSERNGQATTRAFERIADRNCIVPRMLRPRGKMPRHQRLRFLPSFRNFDSLKKLPYNQNTITEVTPIEPIVILPCVQIPHRRASGSQIRKMRRFSALRITFRGQQTPVQPRMHSRIYHSWSVRSTAL